MLNVGKLRKGGENYYLNSVAKGVEDYYVGSGEAPGYWISAGTDDLGLSGEVEEVALRNVLQGSHPISGTELVAPRKGERVPGFDLTFRAPKSVALLHALGPKEASNQVVSAHDSAVAASLDYLERVASGARRGKGGKVSIESKGFVGAAFRHRTSRAGDPLLHTHVLVANLIKGVDGKWGALDARHLYLHAKTAGYLYQSHLRSELTRRLGVEWGPVRNGAADLDGVPREVIRAFSRRRSEIEQASGGADTAGGPRGQMAALTTRKAKDYDVSPEALLPEWRERAERLGLSQDDLGRLLDKEVHAELGGIDRAALERELAGRSGLTAQSSTFSRRDAIQGVSEKLPAGAAVADVEALADEFLASTEVVALGDDEAEAARFRLGDSPIAAGTREARYTTLEMLAVERRVVGQLLARRLDGVGIATGPALADALAARPSLYEDQVAMVVRLASSGAGVDLVVGKAGTGKTYALAAAREVWEASGYRVLGCALAARAAQELEKGSGIASITLAKLLHQLGDPRMGGFGINSVVVVDEAGMVGTRDLDRLLEHAHRDGAKVVLVGDDAQLPEISAGGGFRGMKNRLPSIELTEVRRQPSRWERDALELVRTGRATEAVDAYLARSRVFAARDADETRKRLVDEWWTSFYAGEEAVMIAARRSDVAALNAEARARMVQAGHLYGEPLEVAGHPFCVRDAVMTTRNATHIGVVNGTRAVVTAVDHEHRTVTLNTDRGVEVTLPRSYLEAGHLTHAYAVTGHRSQGMTTDRTFVLVDETLYREWGYVAMSRGRLENRLYVVAGVDLDREDTGGQVERASDPIPAMTRALGRSRAKELALDALEAEELKSLSQDELRRELALLEHAEAAAPSDPSGDLDLLARRSTQVEALVERQRRVADDAASRLEAMGALGRLKERAHATTLRQRVNESRVGLSQLTNELTEIGAKQHRLRDGLGERHAWALDNAPLVRRRRVVERELALRGIGREASPELTTVPRDELGSATPDLTAQEAVGADVASSSITRTAPERSLEL